MLTEALAAYYFILLTVGSWLLFKGSPPREVGVGVREAGEGVEGKREDRRRERERGRERVRQLVALHKTKYLYNPVTNPKVSVPTKIP